jgi:hypothetical protein
LAGGKQSAVFIPRFGEKPVGKRIGASADGFGSASAKRKNSKAAFHVGKGLGVVGAAYNSRIVPVAAVWTEVLRPGITERFAETVAKCGGRLAADSKIAFGERWRGLSGKGFNPAAVVAGGPPEICTKGAKNRVFQPRKRAVSGETGKMGIEHVQPGSEVAVVMDIVEESVFFRGSAQSNRKIALAIAPYTGKHQTGDFPSKILATKKGLWNVAVGDREKTDGPHGTVVVA